MTKEELINQLEELISDISEIEARMEHSHARHKLRDTYTQLRRAKLLIEHYLGDNMSLDAWKPVIQELSQEFADLKHYIIEQAGEQIGVSLDTLESQIDELFNTEESLVFKACAGYAETLEDLVDIHWDRITV